MIFFFVRIFYIFTEFLDLLENKKNEDEAQRRKMKKNDWSTQILYLAKSQLSYLKYGKEKPHNLDSAGTRLPGWTDTQWKHQHHVWHMKIMSNPSEDVDDRTRTTSWRKLEDT